MIGFQFIDKTTNKKDQIYSLFTVSKKMIPIMNIIILLSKLFVFFFFLIYYLIFWSDQVMRSKESDMGLLFFIFSP